MKSMTILFVFTSLFIINSSAQDWTKSQNSNSAVLSSKKSEIKWDKKIHDFGSITHKVPKKAEFELTNTGGKPIIVKKAIGSCGCTDIQFSKEPVLPGKSTKISTVFDAASIGSFNKTITVYLNIEDYMHVLQVKGTVVKDSQ